MTITYTPSSYLIGALKKFVAKENLSNKTLSFLQSEGLVYRRNDKKQTLEITKLGLIVLKEEGATKRTKEFLQKQLAKRITLEDVEWITGGFQVAKITKLTDEQLQLIEQQITAEVASVNYANIEEYRRLSVGFLNHHKQVTNTQKPIVVKILNKVLTGSKKRSTKTTYFKGTNIPKETRRAAERMNTPVGEVLTYKGIKQFSERKASHELI